jgi:hypothetical protein
LYSPSIQKFDHEFTYSGFSAALGHEPFGGELKVERLGPNGASKYVDLTPLNTLPYLQSEQLVSVIEISNFEFI